MLNRWIVSVLLAFSLLAMTVASGWLVLFLMEWPSVVPSINRPLWVVTTDTVTAVQVNVALMLLFGLQHSLMARPQFKTKLITVLDPRLERLVYNLSSTVVLGSLLLCWQPITISLWSFASPLWSTVMGTIFMVGLLISGLAAMSIDGSELAGIRQTRNYLENSPWSEVAFQEPWIYRHIRHPMQLGVLIMLWATTELTLGRLLFSTSMTLYVFIGLYFEEKQLIRNFGASYQLYRQRVPMIIPFIKF